MKNRPLFCEATKKDMDQMKLYLLKKGVPPSMITQIRQAFINDAVRNGTALQLDRVYAALALSIHRAYGFGPKRLMRAMHAFDDLVGYVAENDTGYDWTELMQQLRDETGYVIHSDEPNRLFFEYAGTDTENAKEVN